MTSEYVKEFINEYDLKTVLSALKNCKFKDYTDLELEGIIDDWKREVINNRGGKLREYKDRLFKFLFKDKDRLLSLYNALNNSDYKDASELTIVDLESSLCLGMRGDLSYILSSGLWLYEEQSSWNPNMPLRMLFQIADIYKGLVNKRQLYKTSRILLKNPHFVTFYCGDKRFLDCDEMELKLSDAYEKGESESELELELKVRVININDGFNDKLMEACEALRGYARLNDKVKEYKLSGMDIDEAVSDAIRYCINNNILAEFLREYQNEVELMLSEVYTFEDFRSDMNEELDVLNEELGMLNEELGALNEELSEARVKLSETKVELSETKVELSETKDELSETKDELSETKDELNETKDELNETKDELNETKDELNETKDELNETKDELNETRDELNGARDELSETKDENASLKAKLAEQDAYIEQLLNQLGRK